MTLRASAIFFNVFIVGFLLAPDSILTRLVRETRRTVLVRFDERWVWIPKAWILRRRRTGGGEMRIKVSEYDWAKKFG